ncbi:MAG: hypothetical protein AAGC85_19890 [Bacteroidota bacterium]
MPKIYAIPGLSTDHRIFDKLNIGDMEVLPWLVPDKGETISSYAQRLGTHIPEDEEIILLGFSLGGILSQELAVFKQVKQLILLSTICHKEEKPGWFSILRGIPVYKWVGGRSLRSNTFPRIAPFLGIHDKTFCYLMQDMINDFDPNLRTWAVEQVLYWEGVVNLPPIYRLHGSRDQIFPANKVKRGEKIAEGDHFMLYLKAEIISHHIQRALTSSSI